MKRIFLIAITLLLCISTQAQIKIDKSKPVLIMIGAEWCTSCRSMKNNVLREPMVENLMQNYNFVYIDMDSGEAAMVVAKLREQGYKGGIPYFAIMQQDGKVTNSLSGVRTSEDFCKFLLNPTPKTEQSTNNTSETKSE